MVRTPTLKAKRRDPRAATSKKQASVSQTLLHDKITSTVSSLDRQRLQEALRESEHRYRSLVFATSQVVWMTTAWGDVVEDLPTWRQFTGQTEEELMGRGWSKAIHPDDIDHVTSVWNASLLRKTEHTDEFRVRRHDGVYRTMRSHAVPIIDAAGNVREWVGTCADITDERQQEENYKFLLQAGQLLSLSLDYETTLQRVADLAVTRLADWCTVHIVEEDGSIVQVALAHRDPKMVEFAKELNRKYPSNYDRLRAPGGMLETGKPELVSEITDEMLVQGARDAEHLRITRNLNLSSYMALPMITRGRTHGIISFFACGHTHYVQEDVEFAEMLAVRAGFAMDNAKLYRKSQQALGQIQELNKGLEDKVSERTEELFRAQQKDRANYQRMSFMIRNLPLAAIALDEHNVVLEVNDLFCQTLGFRSKPEEMIGRPWKEFLDQWSGSIMATPRQMKALEDAARDLHPLMNQELQLCDGRILLRDYVPILEGGKKYGHLIIYRDVTQERRIDATKSEFMSLASHQLRTPLTAIRWIFGRLEKNLAGKVGELEEQLLDDGRSAAARMSETINTMLQISRIQSGQVQIDRQEISLLSFFNQLAQSYADNAAQKSQIIIVDCSTTLSVVTDPHLLHEAMSNLFCNALKYTPENGRISLSAQQLANKITIIVQDSGYGIPHHQQSRVFHKFFRGDNVISKDPDGTGLGLHMVSLITELLGGEISFESEQGRGTTFRLTVPAH